VNCPDKWLNDGKCDDECSNPANEWDGGDCEDQMPPGFCPHAWLSDGECDAVCDTEQHGFDQAPGAQSDCACRDRDDNCYARVESGTWSCSQLLCPTCPKAHLCDKACHIGCDGLVAPTPPAPAPPPPPQGSINEFCPAADRHTTVLSLHCNNNGGRCISSQHRDRMASGLARGSCGGDCACWYDGCPAQFRGDGICDEYCNTAAYNFDTSDGTTGNQRAESDCKGSKVEYLQCPREWIGNGHCDLPCNNADNDYDYPDCKGQIVSLFGQEIVMCPSSWLGDHECDIACNTKEFNWDHGDCLNQLDTRHGEGVQPRESAEQRFADRVVAAQQSGNSGG
jgi:hypothetical protein